jgi:SAM-dependent methyltransferase
MPNISAPFKSKLHLCFGTKQENIAFPYHSNNKDKAESFCCIEGSSIEIEYLEFIKSLILITKPQRVLETGCYLGYSTIALSCGIKENGFGELTSIDIKSDYIDQAKKNISIFDDQLKCNFFCGKSLDIIAKINKKFSFVLLDSGSFSSHLSLRIEELNMLLARKMLDLDSTIVIHDTSRFDSRFNDFNLMIDNFCKINQFAKMRFDLSRGCTIIKPLPTKIFM